MNSSPTQKKKKFKKTRRWVSMMLQNTTATAAFNGWRSASFPERSGVQQGSPLSPLLYVLAAQPFFFFFFLGYMGIVHPPSADEGTKRTWFEPEQRPRKRVPKRLVHGKQSPQGASKMSWRQDDSGCDVSLNLLVYGEHHMLLRLLSLQLCNEYLSLLK